MPSYIFVWEQNMYQNQKVAGHTWPGHSSLNIGSRFITGREGPKDGATIEEILEFGRTFVDNYVSWWPTKPPGGFGVAGALSPKKIKGIAGGDLASDIIRETYLPDHVIQLDTTTNEEALMQAEWKAIRRKRNASYKIFRKNCSTIVSRVLQAGGYYSQKWAENTNWVWAPSDILRLSLAAGGVQILWKDFSKLISKAGIKISDIQYIREARSGLFCSCGAPVAYQKNGYTPAR